MDKRWICFFSQTGSEINEIRKALKRDPDLIVTNRTNLDGVNSDLRELLSRFYFLPYRPKEEDYKRMVDSYRHIFNNCIITLHGYLRIMPRFMCDSYEILNSHPGDVTLQNGILKGFNPQEKAFNLKLDSSGSTIHRCTSELDGGEILDLQKVSIKGMTLDQVYKTLHDNSVFQWIKYLKNIL